MKIKFFLKNVQRFRMLYICVFYINLEYLFSESVIPISFFDTDRPYCEILIDSELKIALFDTGLKDAVSFNAKPESIQKGNKKFGMDFIGNKSVFNEVNVKNITIGSFQAANIIATSPKFKGISFEMNKPVYYKEFEDQASFGTGLFVDKVIITDFQKKKIIIVDEVEELKEIGYELSQWYKTPFKYDDFHVEFEGILNGERLPFLLDSGASFNVISWGSRKENVTFIRSCKLESVLIGECIIDKDSFFELTAPFDSPKIILGSPFFISNTVCIDTKNLILYFKPVDQFILTPSIGKHFKDEECR